MSRPDLLEHVRTETADPGPGRGVPQGTSGCADSLPGAVREARYPVAGRGRVFRAGQRDSDGALRQERPEDRRDAPADRQGRKVWVNGHEWAKRQAAKAGNGFTALSNEFASCHDPAALQEICDRLGPGTIRVFLERWWARLPLPYDRKDREGGYWWETSMRQVETPRTMVFDAPRRARAFFEALCADNLDPGRPHNMEIVFDRQIRRNTRGAPPPG